MSLNYESIIKQMSLEEKALMMSGKNTWETVDFEKYGIPSMAMSDGPHGLISRGSRDHGCQCDLRTGIKHQEKPALWKKF